MHALWWLIVELADEQPLALFLDDAPPLSRTQLAQGHGSIESQSIPGLDERGR